MYYWKHGDISCQIFTKQTMKHKPMFTYMHLVRWQNYKNVIHMAYCQSVVYISHVYSKPTTQDYELS